MSEPTYEEQILILITLLNMNISGRQKVQLVKSFVKKFGGRAE